MVVMVHMEDKVRVGKYLYSDLRRSYSSRCFFRREVSIYAYVLADGSWERAVSLPSAQHRDGQNEDYKYEK